MEKEKLSVLESVYLTKLTKNELRFVENYLNKVSMENLNKEKLLENCLVKLLMLSGYAVFELEGKKSIF